MAADLVTRELASLRDQLLDLSLRNSLLNYRPSKTRSLSIADTCVDAIFARLVGAGSALSFREKGVGSSAEKLVSLATELTAEALERRLSRIAKEGASAVEEQGCTMLFLALGTLRWKERETDEVLRSAPLVMLPCTLARKKVGAKYELRWTDEELMTNISLKAKLATLGLEIPDIDPADDEFLPSHYAAAVAAAVASKEAWEVVPSVDLGFFSFSKFIMHKDLEEGVWPEDTPLAGAGMLEALLGEGRPFEPSTLDMNALDRKTPSVELFQVLDADPSQQRVIEEIKRGRSVLVEGPPGTGKSQTITNVIAELLAMGKTVLFVSEKMAALEVVKSRLDAVGLGGACLELHSQKSTKRHVANQIRSALEAEAPPVPKIAGDHDRLDALKLALNDYADALHEQIEPLQKAPYDLIARLSQAWRHFENREIPALLFDGVETLTPTEWAETWQAVGELADMMGLIGRVPESPWLHCQPAEIFPDDEARLRQDLQEMLRTIAASLQRQSELTKALAVPEVRCLDAVNQLCKACDELLGAAAAGFAMQPESVLAEDWQRVAELEQLVAAVAEVQQSRDATTAPFEPDAALPQLRSVRKQLSYYAKRWFRFMLPGFYACKKELRLLYREEPPTGLEQILTDLNACITHLEAAAVVTEHDASGRAAFGADWAAENSSVDALKAALVWAPRLREHLSAGRLTATAVQTTKADEAQTREQLDALYAPCQDFVEQLQRVFDVLKPDSSAIWQTDLNAVDFETLAAQLRLWTTSLPALARWSQFLPLRARVAATRAGFLLPLVDAGEVAPDDLQPLLEVTMTSALLKHVFQQRPVLRNFVTDSHTSRIQDFQLLDADVLTLNQLRAARKLFDERPVLAGDVRGSKAALLMEELKKKRKLKSPRRLISETASVLQAVKPCFMMSPMSVAQYLQPGAIDFDVVIFDEASQVRPQDGLGALARARQLVVMGDSKQLPPTSFFDRLSDSEDHEDDDEDDEIATMVAQLESVLAMCKGRVQEFSLLWHYRSQHESLIMVSNQESYNNTLRVFPAAAADDKNYGVHFHCIPDAVYDKGRSRQNRKEAEVVAQAVIAHYRKSPQTSLGVGTFSVAQKTAIEDAIDFALQDNPDLYEHFQSDQPDHFFVKNLETIQGDERDVIFVSVGYGKDSTGRVTASFGPVNQKGGERRLNVLFSRARQRCEVFCNFSSAELRVDESNAATPLGLRFLKVYLCWAENRVLRTIANNAKAFDSGFEESVYEFLTARGYEIVSQVGCEGFRIDLAIRDPRQPGNYCLAVECDGYRYHSSVTARERDRLRQGVLERMGWRVYRIWSTDWYRNRRDAEQRLLQAVKQAASAPLAQTGASALPPLRTKSEMIDADATRETTKSSDPYEGRVEPYDCYAEPIELGSLELHEVEAQQMARYLKAIVDIESPVHTDEVLRRLREACGISRAGRRIREAFAAGLGHGRDQAMFSQHSSFLWRAQERPVVIRKRDSDASPSSVHFAPEEIAEAICLVAEVSFGGSPPDVINRAAKLFGIQSVSKVTATDFQKAFDAALVAKRIRVDEDGLVHPCEPTHDELPGSAS